jgi:hypothetical protein
MNSDTTTNWLNAATGTVHSSRACAKRGFAYGNIAVVSDPATCGICSGKAPKAAKAAQPVCSVCHDTPTTHKSGVCIDCRELAAAG